MIYEHMVHENVMLESFISFVNPVNLENPVEKAICGVPCGYS